MIRKITLTLLIVLAAAGICFAEGVQEAPASAAMADGRIGELHVGTTNKLDKVYKFHFGGIWPVIFTHETLVWPDSDGSMQPVLAESWEISDDMKTWTFHMVKDAVWHDGVPVTAHDFVFTVEYFREHSKYKSSYRHLVSVEATDDYTVVLKIDEGDYSWLGSIGKKDVIPKHIWEGIDEPYKYDDMTKTSIGCGPYEFVGYDKAAGIATWQAFEGYRGGKPNVDIVKIHEFGNEDTMIMALDKGQIDVTYSYARGISYFNVPKLMKNDDIRVDTISSNGITNNLWFNTKRAPYDNPMFRNAISYLIDYEELRMLFTAGYGDTVYRGWVPDKGFEYYKETEALTRDLDKAKALLDKLGYVDRDGDGMREAPDGSACKPELTIESTKSEYIRVGERLVKYFNDAGLDCQLKLIDRSVFFDVVEDTETFDMILAGTTYSGMTAYAGYGTAYVDDRDFGWATYENKEFQSMTDRLHTTMDEKARAQLVHDLMDHYADYVPVFTLYNMGLLQPSNRKYEGYTVAPIFGIMSPATWFNLRPAK